MAEPQPVYLSAERVLEIAAPMLSTMGREWRLVDGPMVRCGSIGVRILPPDSDPHGRLDFEILLDADRPGAPTIVDCAGGLGADPLQAVRRAIGGFICTSLATVIELFERQGRLANHYQSGEAGGFPGWHAIVSGMYGFAADGSQVKQEWFYDAMPWSTLAPVIATGLDRPLLNGVSLLVAQDGDAVDCEIRINGQRHEPSCTALAALDWPRTERFGMARTFVLLVGPEQAV
ncbi:hypothetical protein Ais01nite_13160 [Asanoa ishikariensis]|uniref:Uncharacterized protein n=1 Tax=Asanoa ishikariensis TaxID=137265 RepID=A0A1H3SXU7_9ACTN|nr:DUF6348 family protein [Asanoa ishikariensis]GIF63281.1 hypothetical protein Ais01nite_13160 [Asanoa ishikariensis]SDZ42802.1 hypothetical protein SAMN05421684_4911 [Asanoa ishikariensis]